MAIKGVLGGWYNFESDRGDDHAVLCVTSFLALLEKKSADRICGLK